MNAPARILFTSAALGAAALAHAEADGPDHWRVKSGIATLRSQPAAGAPALESLPAAARCLPNRGCEGGLTFQEFQTLSPEDRKRLERERPRWCRVEARGVTGWVEGTKLAEDGCPPPSKGPSFDCRKAKAGSIEALVCGDEALSALDRRMAAVYGAAQRRAAREKPAWLKPMQVGWIRERNDCWKETDKHACVRQSYVNWIAELQVRYRLVPYLPAVRFACDGDARNEVVVTYFQSEPATAWAERGDETSILFQQPVASGTHYVGRNESIREHQGEARITWGYGAKEMACRPRS